MARGRNTVKSRGRPPKNAESAQRLAAMKKPKYLYSGQHGASPSTSSAGYSPAIKSSSRKSSSRKESTSRRKPSPWEEDDDDDMDDELESTHFQSSRSRYFEEYENDEDDDLMEEDECDEFECEEMNGDDDCGEDTNDTTTDGSNQQLRRPKPPPIEDEDEEKEVEQLVLPPSSTDLCVYSSDHLMRSLSIYEILRHFSQIVRLEVFRFEDFLIALHLRESSSLFSQIHIQLLKALIREDDLNQTTQGPQDVKDSINGSLYFIDHLTWPQVLKTYLSGDEKGKKIIEKTFESLNDEYPLEATMDHKLILLEYLCDCFLQTSSVRELITSNSLEKGTLRHDDHCRICHKLGDLLCCEGCEAVYHLYCLDPPLESVPKDDIWICDLCKQMSVEGVTDCYTSSAGTFCIGGRQEPLGWDRHHRKYWFMARRLFVEDTKSGETSKVLYYTLEEQFEKVYQSLSEDYEKDLLQTLNDLKDEIKRQMNLTKKLTQQAFQKAKVQQKLKIWFHDGELQKEDDHKDSENGEGDTKSTENEHSTEQVTTGGILTRLKSGTIQQKQINLDPLKVNHQQQNEDDYILYEKEVNGVKQLDKMQKKMIKLNSGIKFKLGFDGLVFTYKNKYTSNPLALNKHQHQEERDKRRFTSHKYSLTTASEFKWQNETKYESKDDQIQMLRSTLLHLESLIFAPFLHPNWGLHKQNWIKAVQMCCNTKDFLLALMILESSLKPCLFNAIWNESLGHLHLQRQTFAEREERKKNEKKEKREFLEEQEATYLFSLQRCGGGVKYSLGKCKHQIWKQRGEEYRLTGRGGFYWFSALFMHMKQNLTKHPTVEEEIENSEANEPLINVSEQLTNKQKRTFYKRFKYEQPLKVDQLLEKRQLMQQVLNEEKQQQDTKKVATTSCYSPICATSQYLQCYSCICRLQTEQESTRSKFTLMKVVKVGQQLQLTKKIGRRTLGKGQLPPCPRFTTNKSQKKSIFLLPRFELKKLARNAALREVAGFSYTAKLNLSYWKYNQTPRPLFRTCWLWRCITLKSLSGVALQLRLLWSCLRWDDLTTKPPQSGQNVVTNENEVITTELLKRRDLAPFGIKSEYLVRRIIVPIDISGSEGGNSPTHQTFQQPYTPSSSVYSTKLERRQGLRERKRKNYEENGSKGPSVQELWVNEDELELWEMKLFGDKLEKQQQMMKDKMTKEIDTEKFKKNLEENLKKQREELKRKEQAQQQQTSLIHSTPKGTGIKRIFTTKTPVPQQPQQGYAMIKTAAGQTYKVPLSAIP
ncbi:nucleosome-remodeling factor subunit BPTF-like protein, partial [Leptotrombidium deliense]